MKWASSTIRSSGNIPPDETVKLVFNLSQGEDARGPWNEEPAFEYIANPQPAGGFTPRLRSTPTMSAPRRARGKHKRVQSISRSCVLHRDAGPRIIWLQRRQISVCRRKHLR